MKAAEIWIARRKAKTFPRKRAHCADQERNPIAISVFMHQFFRRSLGIDRYQDAAEVCFVEIGRTLSLVFR